MAQSCKNIPTDGQEHSGFLGTDKKTQSFRMHWMSRIETGSEPGDAGLRGQVRTSPLRSCQAADPLLRRRKPKGQKGPSFDLTPPALRHPSLPQPQCCHILLSFSGVKPLVPARNPAGFRQNTVMFREKEVIRAHAGPGFTGGNAHLSSQGRTAFLRSCPAEDHLLRRRKTKGQKGPSFDLTPPALRHPSLPPPQ